MAELFRKEIVSCIQRSGTRWECHYGFNSWKNADKFAWWATSPVPQPTTMLLDVNANLPQFIKASIVAYKIKSRISVKTI